MSRFTLGIDFGTESARAVLVDMHSGEVAASATHAYRSGVIDQHLPGDHRPLPDAWALQDPEDWLESLHETVRVVLKGSGIAPERVAGLGIDFTSCTVLPTDAVGKPLCQSEAWRNAPHAWPKLWKHHAAQSQANRINELGVGKRLQWLERLGGKLSCEWLLPKVLELCEEAPSVYSAAAQVIEAADWVVWQMTGKLARNACAAGYKAGWHYRDGVPSPSVLGEVHPELGNFFSSRWQGDVVIPGQRVGTLTSRWASRLGLLAQTAVAAPMIDAHAAALGGGVRQAGTLFMIMGTSTCHMLLADREVLVPGISGVAKDGIVPGLFGYEAGQAGVGDLFAWFVKQGLPPAYHEEAQRRQLSLHSVVSEKATQLRPGESGLLALDWWNGNRSILNNADLSGVLLGYNLSTKPEEIYRTLIEATAFGTRLIAENFARYSIPIDRIVAGGGLVRNPLVLQIYADVLGQEIEIAGAVHVGAIGAAILAAAAAGPDEGGYATISEAIEHMAPVASERVTVLPQNQRIYKTIYNEYRRLHDYFGRDVDTMRTLQDLRRNAARPAETE